MNIYLKYDYFGLFLKLIILLWMKVSIYILSKPSSILSFFLSYIERSFYPSSYLAIYLSICLSVFLSIYISVYLAIYISCLSIHLFYICQFLYLISIYIYLYIYPPLHKMRGWVTSSLFKNSVRKIYNVGKTWRKWNWKVIPI